jgi:long-subunit acyl-CoA synthetase (AMP-forming)
MRRAAAGDLLAGLGLYPLPWRACAPIVLVCSSSVTNSAVLGFPAALPFRDGVLAWSRVRLFTELTRTFAGKEDRMPDLSASPVLDIAATASSLGQAFRRLATQHPDRVAVRTVDDQVSLTWGALRERVDAVAGGLAELGLERGDTIALMLSNRPEFHVVDLAATTLGATPFSIYQTLAPEQIEYVVSDAAARIAIIEQAFFGAFMKAKSHLPVVEHVIVVDGNGADGTLRLDQVEGTNPHFDVEAACAAVGPDDVLTLIYTSGTTGPPKGVQLSQRNLFSVVRSIIAGAQIPAEGRVISWLPTAHIAERALNYYLPLMLGGTITTCPDPRDIASYLPRVRPNFFFAVPRIWEKLKAGLEAQIAGQPEDLRRQMQKALSAAIEKLRLEQAGKPVPPALADGVAQADRELFSAVRSMLGLDQAAMVLVGAAPTPLEVLEFFHALGIRLAEGWGMSETCATGTVNPPERMKLGTVGTPLPGTEIKLADDGEVFIRGANVMVGYRNQPEKTAETIDKDGWLATGDIGELDADGYLTIVDRKKELIINAAGKNMSPANIESALKGACPLIGQICAIGDSRSYNTALIVLDPDFAPAWAAQNGLTGTPLEALATNEKLIAAVQDGVERGNRKLARVEQIKKFTIIPGDWMPGGDELTPTMKLKRKPIAQKYAADIEAMYP